MTKTQRVIAQISLVLIILAGGFAAMKGLMSLRKPAEKKELDIPAPLLNAMQVSPESIQMTVSGYGTVEPRSNVQVVPQVSGQVVECHSQWVDGGFFKAGEPLIVIEKADYELAVQSAEAVVAQATVALEQEQAESDIARREWQNLNPGQTPKSNLVFRGPQIKSARAQLKAAQAQLKRARLDLARTTISMPFDGRIVSTEIDAGQFVTAGAPVATLYRTDLVEVTVPIEDKDLQWFKVPLSIQDGRQPDRYNSSTARLYSEFAGKEYTWNGVAVRTEGMIDSKSRMVGVVIQVQDPFKTDNGSVPLTPGMFVDIDILGKQMDGIIRVPRYAMHGRDNQVWMAREPDAEDAKDVEKSSDDTEEYIEKILEIVTVKVIRMDKEYAYVSDGLADGDIVITSPLETVTDGMKVRIVLEGAEEQENDA